jgi:hypothetical protein
MTEQREIRRGTRAFVYVFLSIFMVCGLAGIEAWPFSGWRFFVHVRSPVHDAWTAIVTAPGDPPVTVRFSSLPVGFHDFPVIMQHFRTMPPRERAMTCSTWAAAASSHENDARLVIYSVRWDLSDTRPSRTDPRIRRRVVASCTTPPSTMSDDAQAEADDATR